MRSFRSGLEQVQKSFSIDCLYAASFFSTSLKGLLRKEVAIFGLVSASLMLAARVNPNEKG